MEFIEELGQIFYACFFFRILCPTSYTEKWIPSLVSVLLGLFTAWSYFFIVRKFLKFEDGMEEPFRYKDFFGNTEWACEINFSPHGAFLIAFVKIYNLIFLFSISLFTVSFPISLNIFIKLK